jgi:hypothetical protein
MSSKTRSNPGLTQARCNTFYNSAMAEGLKGYDGAFDGVKILHGVAVMAPRIPVTLEGRAAVPAPQFPQARQPLQEADIEPIVQRAIDVIGGREEAMRWLGTPVRALDYATPISRLHDPVSRDQVLAVLTQLEHGVL